VSPASLASPPGGGPGRISSRTRLFAVIGDPVAHSLSPLLQNHFFRLFGLDGVYTALHVPPAALAEALAGARALGFAGLNVTIPHKAAVVPHCSRVAPEVERLGVANTLIFREGRIDAATTDAAGFTASLGEQAGRFRGSSVVLFGAGGSARAVAFALAGLGIAHLTIVNRSLPRAEELQRFCRVHLGIPGLRSLAAADPRLSEPVREAQILINATPAGMQPRCDETPLAEPAWIGPQHFVYDLIYTPRRTRLLQEAAARGSAVQGGLDMLIFQGLAALNLWFGAEYRLAPAELSKVRTLLLNELE